MKYVNAPVMKKDAMALVTGKPVYMDDVAPKDCLIVKVLRSPHAHALIEEINITNALKQKGIECILTYKDVPHRRFTMAGQTFPEPSPYDRYILDQRVRFVGDAVAIVAGEDEAAVDRALKLIKVKYQVLEPVLDYHTAKDNPVLVHPEEDWKALCPVGADNKRNLCASGMDSDGDVDGVMKDCDIVMEGTYHVKAMQQSMMETFRTATYLDTYAWILFEKGNYAEARIYIDDAIKNTKPEEESSVVFEHCGDIYFMTGDVEGALKYWKKALELGTESKTLKQKIEKKKYIAE